MSKLRAIRSLLQTVRTHGPLAKADTGKALTAQLAEVLSLRFGHGRLDPDEYYQYCLYDDRRFSKEAKREYLGRRLENGLIPYLKEGWWIGIAHDKLIACALFERFGLPTPKIHAIFHRVRAFGSAPALRTPEAVAEHLRTQLKGPFVAKPVRGMWGKGVWAVEAVDGGRVRLRNGRELTLDAFVAEACGGDQAAAQGVLFQELLHAHPAIAAACGDRICSVRMVVIVDERGARFVSTLWKVAVGASMADNYWEPGNLVAPVDPATGVVVRPFTGLGRDRRHVDVHPDTGATITGMTLPDWPQATSLCLEAAVHIPDIPMQAWDVALTSRGPVLLEVNVNGGMRLPQLTAERGLFHGELREFLARHGFPPGSNGAVRPPSR